MTINEVKKPVVTILGHINHGKSTLIDYLKKTNKVDTETNSITQHIGAYEFARETPSMTRHLTLIDTPGHAAFFNMREGSISVADIALLLIAADDGVKEQTKDSLKAIQDAGIPYVVVFTKKDKVSPDVVEKTKLSTLEHSILLEGLGGDVPYAVISSKTGDGVDELLDTILLLDDIQEKTKPHTDVCGIIFEVGLDSKKGVYADVIAKGDGIQQGTYICTKDTYASTRIMHDCDSKNLQNAINGTGLRIYGFVEPPKVGSALRAYESKKDALTYIQKNTEVERKPYSKHTKDFIPVTLKADVAGVLQAIESEIEKLNTEEFPIMVTKSSVGAITEADIKAAKGMSAKTVILSFNTKIDSKISNFATKQEINIASFKSIYELIDWLKAYIAKHNQKEAVLKGKAAVIRTFVTQNNYQVFGAKIQEGEFSIGDEINIIRSNKNVAQAPITNIEQSNEKRTTVEGLKTEFAARITTSFTIAIGDSIESFTK